MTKLTVLSRVRSNGASAGNWGAPKETQQREEKFFYLSQDETGAYYSGLDPDGKDAKRLDFVVNGLPVTLTREGLVPQADRATDETK